LAQVGLLMKSTRQGGSGGKKKKRTRGGVVLVYPVGFPHLGEKK